MKIFQIRLVVAIIVIFGVATNFSPAMAAGIGDLWARYFNSGATGINMRNQFGKTCDTDIEFNGQDDFADDLIAAGWAKTPVLSDGTYSVYGGTDGPCKPPPSGTVGVEEHINEMSEDLYWTHGNAIVPAIRVIAQEQNLIWLLALIPIAGGILALTVGPIITGTAQQKSCPA